MNTEEIELEALKLDAKSRARLAMRLLESLDSLSRDEIDRLWAEEASERAKSTDRADRPAYDVFEDAKSRLK